jgi:hypothetical protein
MVQFFYFTEAAVYWCYLVTASDISFTSVKSVYSKQMHINQSIMVYLSPNWLWQFICVHAYWVLLRERVPSEGRTRMRTQARTYLTSPD